MNHSFLRIHNITNIITLINDMKTINDNDLRSFNSLLHKITDSNHRDKICDMIYDKCI